MKEGLIISYYGMQTKSFLKIRDIKTFKCKVGLWCAKDREGNVFNIKEGEKPDEVVLALSDFGENPFDNSETDLFLVSDNVYGVYIKASAEFFVDKDLMVGDILAVSYKENCGKLYKAPFFDRKDHIIVAKVVEINNRLSTVTYVTIYSY